MAQIKIVCPKCGKSLPPKFLYSSIGRLRGSVKSDRKRKGSEEMSRIARARWDKIKKAEPK
jgi:hypothetical protein